MIDLSVGDIQSLPPSCQAKERFADKASFEGSMTTTVTLNSADEPQQQTGRLALRAMAQQRYQERATLTDLCRKAELKTGGPVYQRLDAFHEQDRPWGSVRE